MPVPLSSGDQKLIQITDAALADASRRSGEWLVCRVGCTQCCIGVFAINQLDALRLQRGMAELERRNPVLANRVRQRARASIAHLEENYPGDPLTGLLHEGAEAEAQFEDFGNDEPCPALNPDTGACDLYEARPMTCRVFGPPVRSEGGLGVCELCYHGATDAEIAGCEMSVDPDGLEAELVAGLEREGRHGQTIVAFVLAE